MPKVIRKRVSLKAPRGPTWTTTKQMSSPDNHQHTNTQGPVSLKKAGAGGPVAQRSGNGGKSFNNPHEQPRRPSMHKHPKTSVIKSNQSSCAFRPHACTLRLTRAFLFHRMRTRSFCAFLEIKAWAKNSNNQLLNNACKKNAPTHMRTINEI